MMPRLSIIAFALAVNLAAAFAVLTPAAQAASGLTEVTLAAAADTNNARKQTVKPDEQQSGMATTNDAPLLTTVSLNDQRLKLFRGVQQIETSRISSGKQGHTTPMGIYTILGKKKFHRSNIYSNAPMPYMQRLTWSGIALHQSNSVPNYPASHGCVRLPANFAKSLYNLTSTGVHVIIAAEEAAPYPIRHKTLFQPDPEQTVFASLRTSVSAIDEAQQTNRDKPLRIYVTRTTLRDETLEVQHMLNLIGYFVGKEDGIYGGQTIAAIKRFQMAEGLKKTGTLSDETKKRLLEVSGRTPLPKGRLYVRQGQKPVFESPVEIRNPQKPLGTHLLMTNGFTDEATGWMSVSLASRIPKSIASDHEMDLELASRRSTGNASDALDRIEIPSDAREFIEENLQPGTSFIISDNGWGSETADGTDFIVPIY